MISTSTVSNSAGMGAWFLILTMTFLTENFLIIPAYIDSATVSIKLQSFDLNISIVNNIKSL